MARPIKNVTVTRRVSEAENPINAGPRLRVGLLFVLADETFFMGRAIDSTLDCSFEGYALQSCVASCDRTTASAAFPVARRDTRF